MIRFYNLFLDLKSANNSLPFTEVYFLKFKRKYTL